MRKSFYVVGGMAIAVTLTGWLESCRSGDKKDSAQKPTTNGFEFREKLSEYGFFTGNLAGLQPSVGVLRYELATPLFTDYTVKDRFIVLPKGKSIQYTSSGILDFPDSTVIIKNFAYRNELNRKVMLETRLLVKDPVEKTWKVMDYLWDSTQTDAVKHITGAKIPITLLDDENKSISTVYQVPNTNDCKRCHYSTGALTPIGPKARNLNTVLAGHSENQLTEWAKLNKLAGLPSLKEVEKMPDWKDSVNYTLGERSRAYLDANCAHCHTKGGDAMNTGLFLEYEQQDRQHLGIMKSPVSAGAGAGGMNYDIVPGDATNSILVYRMNSTEAGTAMPELARTIIHKEAVHMIEQWINQMKKEK